MLEPEFKKRICWFKLKQTSINSTKPVKKADIVLKPKSTRKREFRDWTKPIKKITPEI